jgi:phosphomannomutase
VDLNCSGSVHRGVPIGVMVQGLCAYVLAHVDNARDRGAVIGYDHRHNSERWARLTAAAFVDKGVKTYLYRGLVHTPMRVTYLGRTA